MNVQSTRGNTPQLSALQSVLEGIAADGGLFVPDQLPKLDQQCLLQDFQAGYPEVVARILGQFFDVEFQTLLEQTTEAYAHFSSPQIAPVKTIADGVHVLELFHGPTLAFKDMALQVLPRLMRLALEAFDRKEDALVLTATSGDTGKAALEGFKDVPRTSVFVFYPQDGVAEMQRLQMVTQKGKNVGVCAIKGNFDDAQTGVKQLFTSKDFIGEIQQTGRFLSSANSINIGRLIPQIAYYCSAYAQLKMDGFLSQDDEINFVVPTGNFGNILAAHYARSMGLPIRKLICASNRNNVLTDFFTRGTYDARRDFHKTMSPSMDILVSSNLERLLFEICDRDSVVVREWMDALKSTGKYEIPGAAREKLSAEFYADFSTDEETATAIRTVYADYGYLMDPHTAVAQDVYRKYHSTTGDETPTVIVSTANPYKFPTDVWQSLTGQTIDTAFEAAEKLSEYTKIPIPPAIDKLKNSPELHAGIVEKNDLGSAVTGFLATHPRNAL